MLYLSIYLSIYIYIYIYISSLLLEQYPADELMCDVLQWTPSHGRAKAGRPVRTYVQQLCADTGYSPEDQPEAIDDR